MTSPAVLWTPARRTPPASSWPRLSIDVSNHQGLLSQAWFEEWTERGYGGLIVQGVESVRGETFTRRQLLAAQEAGWRSAGYVWCRAGQANDLEALGKRLTYFDGFKLDFLALDIEEMGTARRDVDLSLQLCDAYHGAPAWIYTAKWVFDGLRWTNQSLWPERKLWTASYDGIADVDAGFVPYGGWSRCDLKQFTDKPLDQNVARP